MKTIALDFGGTQIKIGIVEHDAILASRKIEALSSGGLRPRLVRVEETIHELLAASGIRIAAAAGIGISVPGIVDTRETTVLSVNEKYADSVGFDFSSWSRERFSLPIVLENDARAALTGEWRFGAGRGCDNIVMVTLGTGVGGAALIEGKLLYGKHYQAGCLGGHFTISYDGPACNCGNIGCVEAEASSWRLPLLAKDDPAYAGSLFSRAPVLDYEHLFACAAQKDTLSEKLLRQSLLAWSSGIVNLIHAYDPERVIIGGGLMRSADIILPFITSEVHKRAWTPWGKVTVVKAQDIDNAALLGIAFLLNAHQHQ